MSLEDIDSALMIVCLEEEDLSREQAAEFSHMMLHGNGKNRCSETCLRQPVLTDLYREVAALQSANWGQEGWPF